MPLKWEKGKNPYACTCFARLQVGPATRPAQIVQRAKNLAQKIAAGENAQNPSGAPMDEHAVQEASSKLREPASLAEELLLAHPPAPEPDAKKAKEIFARLKKAAVLPGRAAPLSLAHPLAILWFTPAPGPETAELPGWKSLDIPEAEIPSVESLGVEYDG
jgi:hypothetical protein